MVLRVEYILLVSLAIVFGFIVMERPHSVKAVSSNTTKEIFFKNFSLVELTPKGVENQIISSGATKYKEYFEFNDINVTYKKSHNLLAKKAIYKKDFLYVKDDIVLSRDDGFAFTTNNLKYNIKEKVAYSDEDFVMDINESRISGQRLRYDLNLQEVSADGIRATIVFE